jgi:hypothetical protein
MAPASLPKPGTKYGPCKGPCEHRDCAETRRTAEFACPTCTTPIGYDRLFYKTDGSYEHAYCAEDRTERESHP